MSSPEVLWTAVIAVVMLPALIVTVAICTAVISYTNHFMHMRRIEKLLNRVGSK